MSAQGLTQTLPEAAIADSAEQARAAPLEKLRAYPEIDGVRGVLSLLVMAGHTANLMNWPVDYGEGQSPLYWYWGCMEVFFCISGFLITRGLLQSCVAEPHWIRRYLAKRALRIWPAYYAALAFSIAISLWITFPPAPVNLVWDRDLSYLLKTIFFLQNTELYWQPASSAHAIPTFGHSWSVALEEQFYLSILLAIFLRKKFGWFPGRWILVPLVLLLPMSQITRIAGLSGWALFGRAEAFTAGVILAFLEPDLARLRGALASNPRLARWLAWLTMVIGAAFLSPYLEAHGRWSDMPIWLRYGPTNPFFAFTVFSFFLLATFVASPNTPVHALLRTPVLRYLGEISYSTYLFQVGTLLMLYSLFNRLGVSMDWLALGPLLVLCVSSATYRSIEVPFLTLKKRLSSASSA